MVLRPCVNFKVSSAPAVAGVIEGACVHHRQVGKGAAHRGGTLGCTDTTAIPPDAFIAGEARQRDARWRPWSQRPYDLVPAERLLVIDRVNAPLSSLHQVAVPGKVVVRNAEKAPSAINLSAAAISGAK